MTSNRLGFFLALDIILPNIMIENYGDLAEALIPIFDSLWNAAGLPECPRGLINSLREL
jgi:hypothetical protein